MRLSCGLALTINSRVFYIIGFDGDIMEEMVPTMSNLGVSENGEFIPKKRGLIYFQTSPYGTNETWFLE